MQTVNRCVSQLHQVKECLHEVESVCHKQADDVPVDGAKLKTAQTGWESYERIPQDNELDKLTPLWRLQVYKVHTYMDPQKHVSGVSVARATIVPKVEQSSIKI